MCKHECLKSIGGKTESIIDNLTLCEQRLKIMNDSLSIVDIKMTQ